jgi:hypothetical protein
LRIQQYFSPVCIRFEDIVAYLPEVVVLELLRLLLVTTVSRLAAFASRRCKAASLLQPLDLFCQLHRTAKNTTSRLSARDHFLRPPSSLPDPKELHIGEMGGSATCSKELEAISSYLSGKLEGAE